MARLTTLLVYAEVAGYRHHSVHSVKHSSDCDLVPVKGSSYREPDYAPSATGHSELQPVIMSDPDWDLSVYYRIRWYKVLRPPPLHVGHRDNRGPISLAGPGPQAR